MRTALFITCLADAMFPEVGKATVSVLERLEWPLPKGWEEQRRTVARSRSATANR